MKLVFEETHSVLDQRGVVRALIESVGVDRKVSRLLYLFPLMGLAAALPACTRPAVTPKAPAFQARENSVRDWTGVGVAIADSMVGSKLLPPQASRPVAGAPVAPGRYYVNLIRPGIPFLREVAEALKSEIILRGGAVSTSPADSAVVNLDVTYVRWAVNPHANGGDNTVAGLAAGTGAVLASNGPYSAAAVFGMALGLGAALDLLNSLKPETNVEAIWRATVIQNDTYLMDASAPVYVRAGDLRLYAGGEANRVISSYELQRPRNLVQLRYAQ